MHLPNGVRQGWRWDYSFDLKTGIGTLTLPRLGFGTGMENSFIFWDGNWIGVPRPKPTPLSFLFPEVMRTCPTFLKSKQWYLRWTYIQKIRICILKLSIWGVFALEFVMWFSTTGFCPNLDTASIKLLVLKLYLCLLLYVLGQFSIGLISEAH